MPKYTLIVEVVNSYLVEIEAKNEGKAQEEAWVKAMNREASLLETLNEVRTIEITTEAATRAEAEEKIEEDGQSFPIKNPTMDCWDLEAIGY